jgi:uncharacterized protein YndB with AHSA1/START domain
MNNITRTATVTLPADNQVLITREFDAPRHLVFRAYTEPELIKRWWAGDRGTVTSVEMDLRVGGKWRYVMTANGGFEVAFHGECLAVVPDERLVSTEVYEGLPDAEANAALDTLTLVETDGRTLLSVLVEHKTRENRDMHVRSGMEEGMQESYTHLEQVIASLS